MSAAEVAQPLDKLSEKQMAERLGTTARSLEARRSRRQIPEEVWKKSAAAFGIASGDTTNGKKVCGSPQRR